MLGQSVDPLKQEAAWHLLIIVVVPKLVTIQNSVCQKFQQGFTQAGVSLVEKLSLGIED